MTVSSDARFCIYLQETNAVKDWHTMELTLILLIISGSN